MIRKNLFWMAVISLFMSAPLYAQQGKIGVIDMQRALNDTVEGKKVLGRLKTKLNAEKAILDKKEEELTKMQNELNKQGFLLSDRTRMEKEERFRSLQRELERYQEDKREEFMRLQRNSTERIFKGLMKILDDYAKKKNFSLILEAGQANPNMPSPVLYYDEATVDITAAVIKLYDEKSKAGK